MRRSPDLGEPIVDLLPHLQMGVWREMPLSRGPLSIGAPVGDASDERQLSTVVIGDLEIVIDEASTTVSSVPVRNVLPPDLAAAPPTPLERQGEMISFLSDLFGPYPFDEYGIAVVGDFEAALENQTLSIFGRDLVEFPAFFETVLVHELAHQWFGNSVTPADWGDIWLNEGFATYAEWLWIEYTKGAAALEATVRGERNRLALTKSGR